MRGKELVSVDGKPTLNPFSVEAKSAHDQMTAAASELGLLDDAAEEKGRGDTITGSALAQLFGVPVNRIVKYVGDGMPAYRTGRKGGSNRYDADACLGWAVRTGKDTVIEKFLRGTNRSTAMDLNVERAELTRVQTDRAKREHAKEMGMLLPDDDVLREWASILSNARSLLLAIPSAVRGLYPGLPEVGNVVESIVYDALRELSNGNGKEPSK